MQQILKLSMQLWFLCIVYVLAILYYCDANPYNYYIRCIKVNFFVMIYKRIGKRIKQCREKLGLTQEQFAEKTGFSTNYISTLERGASFPRCDKLIILLNALEVPADAIFCDVLTHTNEYKATQLAEELHSVSPEAQKRILQMVELMIQQEKTT